MKLYVAAVALVGCTQSSSPVKAHYVYHYGDGAEIPIDLSQVQFQVLVENGDGYDRYPEQPITGTADGTFEIGDVPDGEFWLEWKDPGSYPGFTLLRDHDIEVARDMLGRFTDVQVAGPTPVMIDATSLAPWATNDRFYIDCFDNATEADDPSLTPALAAGDQAIHASFDWAKTPGVYAFGLTEQPYLMRAGDHVTISRVSTVQTMPVTVTALTQILTTDAPAQSSGQTSTISGAFVDVARTEQLSISADPTSLMTQPNPPARLSVNAVVGPLTDQHYTLGPTLFTVSQAAPTQPVTATASYGNPFEVYRPWVYADFGADWTLGDVTLPISVASEDRPLSAGSFTFEPLPAPSGVTLAGSAVGNTFEVAPDESLQLDAHLADGTSYITVTIWHLDGGIPQYAGYIDTNRMPIAVPAEIFISGERYAFEITSFRKDGDDTRTATATTDEMTYMAP